MEEDAHLEENQKTHAFVVSSLQTSAEYLTDLKVFTSQLDVEELWLCIMDPTLYKW